MATETLETSKDHKVSVSDDDHGQRVDNVQRAQWLRAAILGANDGLLSTTSLMLGIGAAREDRWSVILSGLAGAVAGACSMAVGEYVSVSTQRDIEEMGRIQNSETQSSKQDHESQLNKSNSNLDTSPTVIHGGRKSVEGGAHEIPAISPLAITLGRRLQVFSPGRSPIMRVISEDVQKELKKRDETETLPNPGKAAAASALAFLCGSVVPLVTALFVTENKIRTVAIVMVTSIALALFGGVGAHLGGSSVRVSALRVLIGGWIAMAISYGLLKPFHVDNQNKDSD
ncbi:protein of unknown function DUF125 [Macleaya cordata]|uniref:Vacuolar iron transporter n=1 Tax=Macleaya cordata TaxID=56857 RepID=A0A200PS14_MACCD|nr:protein of unknown function DUF125 [Macleaya cordata]